MTEFVSAGIFVRDNGFIRQGTHEVGWRLDGDVHNFGHMTWIGLGAYRCQKWKPAEDEKGNKLWVLDYDSIIKAPWWLEIEANAKHSFECVEGPGAIFCLFTGRDTVTGESVPWNGWMKAAL